MGRDLIGTLARGLRKPPRTIVRRLQHEIAAEADRFVSPLRARRFGLSALLKATGAATLDELWKALAARPYPALTFAAAVRDYDQVCPDDRQRILRAADEGLAHRIDLLGTGPLDLGPKIDWHKDHRTNLSWPPAYIRSIEDNNPDRPSDVKVPWEISRMQWLIPLGQAYLLTGDEKYAVAVRDVLQDWIAANPYAHSVNWACTMEAALRILTWTWFFHVFHDAASWADAKFRATFLTSLYLHGDFTLRHIERSDVNGNHYTADAAGLVFAGLFFGRGQAPQSWARIGWEILEEELPRQVFPDGVDFEASVPYHRLVAELFVLPALYRQQVGEPIAPAYQERVTAMARFAMEYCRYDGSSPLWGDADDARALPFGGQALSDHRYLPGIVGAAWNVGELHESFSGPRTEIYWVLGSEVAAALPCVEKPAKAIKSAAFPDGGFYIMRSECDHVFIDCGPLGLAGRGGHGHNDCLSFEAALLGERLISDCGAYVYTASYEERNNFRSTAYHNTPRIDGEEINRFVRPDYLWVMHNDAVPEVRGWQAGFAVDKFCGSHSGYQRLASPVTPVRTILLDHNHHALIIEDRFEGQGTHSIEIPLHLAPGVEVANQKPGELRLRSNHQEFLLMWHDAKDYELRIETGRVSPSYGVAVPITRLCWQRHGAIDKPLMMCLLPSDNTLPDAHPLQWARAALNMNIK